MLEYKMKDCYVCSPLLWFPVFYCVLLMTLDNKFNQNLVIGLILVFVGFAIELIRRWVKKTLENNLLDNPFKACYCVGEYKDNEKELVNKIIYKPKDIKFNLYLTARRQINIKEIDIRFVEKKRKIYGKSYFVDAPMSLLLVDKIEDPKLRARTLITKRMFDDTPDEKGGAYGYYNPEYICPKGEIVFLEITPRIKTNKTWKGYISLQVLLGDEERTYTRKKIIIEND